MRKNKAPFLSLIFLVLSGCSPGSSPSMRLLKEHHNDLIAKNDFGICKGYGCQFYLKTGLAQAEWQQITAVFTPPVTNAAAERQQIKTAIALFEQFVGPKTGTASDNPGAQIISFATKDQMDCIDEAFNSSTYLYLLRKDGLIRFHRLGKPLHRGNYITRWPHNTATIHEIGKALTVGGEGHFVVDSWFHANGIAPEIIPASLWMDGWSPQEKKSRPVTDPSEPAVNAENGGPRS